METRALRVQPAQPQKPPLPVQPLRKIIAMNTLLNLRHFYGWFNGAASLLVCTSLLPVVLFFANRWQLHDLPGELKPHAAPTPRLGGLAMGSALLVGISIGGTGLFSPARLVFLALLLVWVVGLLDDLASLPAGVRLVVQIIAGLLVAQTQWRLMLFGSPLLDSLLTCLFIVIFVNALNFFDGADGLVAGVIAVVSLGYVALYSLRGPSVGAAISWSMLGTSVGFLLFNFPPAKLFMGDSGSTVLGFLVAFLGLDFYRVHHAIGTHWLLPIAFAGLPLLDLCLAVVRRVRKRVSPFLGDRQHFYDLLQQRGWSARPIAIGSYLATACFVMLGWFCISLAHGIAFFAITLAFVSLTITAVRLGSLR
jgi:UDP-GlcNAc:undecaprenyl-phosphate GlcNAc-1-phosphate transferase